jgi:hypothetical protein
MFCALLGPRFDRGKPRTRTTSFEALPRNGVRDANNPLAPVKRRSTIVIVLTPAQTTMKRIAAALSVALLLSAVAAFGLNGWTVLAVSQQPVAVSCESGAGCNASPQRLRYGPT